MLVFSWNGSYLMVLRYVKNKAKEVAKINKLFPDAINILFYRLPDLRLRHQH